MSPLLLGAAWILFVVSCFVSMVPSSKPPRPHPSLNAPSRPNRGKDAQPR